MMKTSRYIVLDGGKTMSGLEQYREEINRIDTEMARLFEERMLVSKAIGEYKKEHGLPVKDAARESAIIAKSKERVRDRLIEPYYVDFQKNVMNISCALQSRLISGMKVGYSGVPGAYAYIAAKRLFSEAELVSFGNFEPVFRAAEQGEVDFAVLPLENSYAGDVGAVMDLMFSGQLFINQILDLEIEHYLLGVPGTQTKDIKTVISHPQALLQCDDYIQKHRFEVVEFANTAKAAEHIHQLNDPSVAAIASEETAELFGLAVLDRRIQTSRNNSTRFGVFSRVQNLTPVEARDDSCGFMLMFTVPNEAGSLAMILDIIGAHGFNMQNLKSRPAKSLLWKYYFFVEVEGNVSGEEGQDMMRELGAVCGQLRLVGTFRYE